MKAYLYSGVFGAMAIMFFGCANDASNNQTASNTDPGTKTHTGQQLENSGQAQAGPALKRIDPDVSGSH
jgi:hypothetical protein